MNCTEARQAIDGLPRGSALQGSLSEHLQSCELCGHYYSDVRLVQELSTLEVPAPSPEFLQRALKRATEQAPVGGSRSRWQLPAAIATSLLVGVIALTQWVSAPGEAPLEIAGQAESFEALQGQPELAAPAFERQEVRIVIYSKEDRDSAELTIELAENLELEGYAGFQRLAWNTPLAKGPNLLVLPVLIHNDSGELRVSSRFGDGSHEVNVRVARKNRAQQSGEVQEAGGRPSDGLAG